MSVWVGTQSGNFPIAKFNSGFIVSMWFFNLFGSKGGKKLLIGSGHRFPSALLTLICMVLS